MGISSATTNRDGAMERPVYLGSKATELRLIQWAVRIGEITWTEASIKEGQEKGKTVINGGVQGSWWGWGAKVLGPLHKGYNAKSGASLPPGDVVIGHTWKTDAELEQFNLEYVKSHPIYKTDRCVDYAYQGVGWLVGKSDLLGKMMQGSIHDENDQEVEICRTDSDEYVSENEEYTQTAHSKEHAETSEDEDPTYEPKSNLIDNCSDFDSESEDEMNISKKRKIPQEDLQLGKRRKSEEKEVEEDELSELEEKILDDDESVESDENTEDEYEEGEDEEEEEAEEDDYEKVERNYEEKKEERELVLCDSENYGSNEDELTDEDEIETQELPSNDSLNIISKKTQTIQAETAASYEKDANDREFLESGYGTQEPQFDRLNSPAA